MVGCSHAPRRERPAAAAAAATTTVVMLVTMVMVMTGGVRRVDSWPRRASRSSARPGSASASTR